MQKSALPEPWLRGTHNDIDPIRRGILHALDLCGEDASHWCKTLRDDQLLDRPAGLPPIVFHLRHIVRSLDRLLTYAEGKQLSAAQLDALKSELDTRGLHPSSISEVFDEFRTGLRRAADRIRSISPDRFHESVHIGKKQLPATVGGLLVHCADHSQRHIGQLITTVKVLQFTVPDRE